MIETILIYTLAAYGISAALVYYSGPFDILYKIREKVASNEYLNELFMCMFCLPVNIGIILSVISILLSTVPFTPFSMLFEGHYMLWPLAIIMDAFYTGAAVKIIDDIVESIEDKLDNSDKKILLD